jgi:hypothetical protein
MKSLMPSLEQLRRGISSAAALALLALLGAAHSFGITSASNPAERSQEVNVPDGQLAFGGGATPPITDRRRAKISLDEGPPQAVPPV